MASEIEDYRTSHTAAEKGREYAQSFLKDNNKRFIWEWEQMILAEIVSDLRGSRDDDREISHLDFACGTGRVIGYLRQYVDASTGVDVSESMLGQARENSPDSKLEQVDLTSENPFAERSFDLVSAFRFFVNAQDDLRAQVMSVLSKLVKKDGVLVFNVHIVRSSLFGSSMLLLKRLKGDRSGTFRTMSIGETHRLLNENGLEIVKTYHRGIIPVYNDDAEGVPFGMLRVFENFFSRFSIFRPVSRYIIYVCRPLGASSAE